jgi:hypothetical protein
MKSAIRLLAFVALAVAMSHVPIPSHAQNLGYALDIGSISDDLFSHQIGDLSDRTVTGASALAIVGMDFDPTATTLYALNNNPQELGTLSLTGVFTPIGPSVPVFPHSWTGLAIDPIDGTFFASSSDGTVSILYTLDPATGTARVVGFNEQADAIIDISVNCEGVIYGHEIVSDSIYSIDRTTGVGSLVGQTGLDSEFHQGMDFDNQTGTLYAYTYQGGGANQYGTINLTGGGGLGEFTPLNIDDPPGQFEGASQTTCSFPVFSDDFESGDTTAWSSTVQ